MQLDPRNWFRRRGARAVVAGLRGEVWAESPDDLMPLLSALEQVDSFDFGAGAQPAAAKPYTIEDGIATLSIRGQILREAPWILEMFGIVATDALATRRALELAVADPDVQGLLLEVDSPGGTLTGTRALADAVYVAAGKKPVAAHVLGRAASAAYWIASQAGHVTAERDAQIGSIGVYSVVEDSSRAAEDAGVKVHLVRAGEHKGVGEEGAPITDRHLAQIQATVDAGAEMFRADICRGRRISGEDCAALADGRLFFAEEAARLRLIDAISTHSAARASMRHGRDDEDMDMDKDTKAQIEALTKQVAALSGQLSEIVALAPKMVSATEAAEAQAKAAKEALAADRKRACDELVARGAASGRVAGDTRALVDEYRSLIGDDPDKIGRYIDRLPVQTLGHRESASPEPPSDGGDLVAQVQAEAKKLRERDPSLSAEKAEYLAWKSDPKRYRAYRESHIDAPPHGN